MLAKIILTIIGIAGILLFIRVASGGFGSSGGSGGSANVMFGATQDLLSHDQRKAAEVIIKEQAGEKQEEQESGKDVG